MADQQVKVTLTADARTLVSAFKDAGVSVGDFDKKSTTAAKGFKQAWGEMKGLAGELGLALGLGQVVQGLGQFGAASLQAAGQAQQLGLATDSLAKKYGESGDAMVAAIQNASNGTISELDAMQAANKAMMFGLAENSQQMADLTQVAITLGAAMGQGAAKSIDDLTTALGRQSPLILDNLGITLKMEDAHRIYAESIGKTVDQLTEEEKQQAFVNAALEVGKQKVAELGGVQENHATRSQAMNAAWSDFQVAFGGAVAQMESSLGVMDATTDGINRLAEGANAWAGIAGTVSDMNAQSESGWQGTATAMNAVNTASGGLLGAMNPLLGVFMGYANVQNSVVSVTDETAQKIDNIRIRTARATGDWALYSQSLKEAYESTSSQAQASTAVVSPLTIEAEAALKAAQAYEILADSKTRSAGASQQAIDAQSARYAGLGDTYDGQYAAGQWWNNAAQRVTPDEFIQEQQKQLEEGMSSAIGNIDLGDSFKSVANDIASQIGGAVSDAFSRMKEVAPEGGIIAGMFEAEDPGEFGRRLMALAEGGMEGLDAAWADAFKSSAGGNPIYAGLLQSIEQGDSAGVAAQANELLAGNLADVIATGLVDNLRASFEEQQLMQQVQAIVMEQMAGTGMEGDAAGLLGAMMGDPSAVAGNITGTLQPAVDTLKTSLAGLAGGGGEAAGAAEAAGAGGSSALSPLITDATALDTMFNTTLPASILLTQSGLQLAAEDSLVQFGIMQTAATEFDTQITTLASTTLTNLKTAGQTASDTIKTGMHNAAKTITDKLIPAIDEATRAFRRMADAAKAAASASSSAGANAPDGHQWGGGRAAGGPISAGNLYLVGERGPELFVPGSSGSIIPFRDTPPAALPVGGGGQSLSIGTLVLNGVQDVQALFEGIEREARSRGMQFAMVS